MRNPCTHLVTLGIKGLLLEVDIYIPGFLKCFKEPIRVPKIGNQVSKTRENFQWKFLNG